MSYLGFVGAGFNLFSAILLANVSILEKVIGVRRLLLLTAFLPAILFIALGFVHLLVFAIPALFIVVGCRMVRIPIMNELIHRHVESENRATVISSVSLLERFVTFLLYPVVGRLADLDRSLNYALWLLGGVCLAFAIGTRLSGRHLTGEAKDQRPVIRAPG